MKKLLSIITLLGLGISQANTAMEAGINAAILQQQPYTGTSVKPPAVNPNYLAPQGTIVEAIPVVEGTLLEATPVVHGTVVTDAIPIAKTQPSPQRHALPVQPQATVQARPESLAWRGLKFTGNVLLAIACIPIVFILLEAEAEEKRQQEKLAKRLKAEAKKELPGHKVTVTWN